MKLAPRTVFFAQGFAAILGALTQTGVTLWMLGNIPNICSSTQSSSFTCPNGRTVFSSSVIWGLIGPGRLYSVGKRYSSLLHFFWIGALMPVVTWLLYKKTGKKIFKDVNWPLFFVGTYNVPPATGINYTSWALVNWVFNGYIKAKFFAWWTKYNVCYFFHSPFFFLHHPLLVFPFFQHPQSLPFRLSEMRLTFAIVCSCSRVGYRHSCRWYCHLLRR
jgi:OPT family oligopeptide transporter